VSARAAKKRRSEIDDPGAAGSAGPETANASQNASQAVSGSAGAVRIACTGAGTVDLAELVGLQGGLKDLSPENAAKLRRDIVEQGFSEPIACWRASDGRVRVLNGHQRLRVLGDMRAEGWTVPPLPVSWVEAADETEARRKVLSLGSSFGEVTGDGLRSFMADSGFSLGDVAAMAAFPEIDFASFITSPGEPAADPGAQEDNADQLREKWQTERGQLWTIGTHKLLCGDCTVADDVMRLMGGERARIMNTDPPYGVSYNNADRPNPGVAKVRGAKPWVLNDELRDEVLQSAFRAATAHALTADAAWYLWHAHLTQGFFAAAAAAAAANVVLHRQIIWVKPVLLLGRGQYHWKHEPCFMGWVEGNQPPDYGRGNGERDQTTVWEVDSVTHAERAEFSHSTPKPVALFAVPMVKHLRPGEIAFEPFAGSGPQFVAAQQTGRRCFGIELEPKFCAVILERLAGLGLDPKLAT